MCSIRRIRNLSPRATHRVDFSRSACLRTEGCLSSTVQTLSERLDPGSAVTSSELHK